MKFNTSFLALMTATALVVSCTERDDSNVVLPLGAYDNGILVLNQGNFNGSNAEITYLSNDLGTFQNDVFSIVNDGAVLGDTGQDIGLRDDKAYIVLNVSNKIEIVNRYTFKHLTTINAGLNNPRYIAFSGNSAYVSNWGDPTNTTDDYIAVIDLNSNTVTTSIPVGEGPERILVDDNKLYVAQMGGFGYGNAVTVINLASNTVLTSIEVGDVPNSMVIQNGFLYALCGGKTAFTNDETTGKLTRVNLASNLVTGSLEFTTGQHPANLVENGNRLYYTINNEVYATAPTASALPTAPLLTTEPQVTSGIYAFATKDNRLYVADALDFSANGKVYVYDLNGALQQWFTVGVIPAGFYFN